MEHLPITKGELKSELDRVHQKIDALVEKVRLSDEGLGPDGHVRAGTHLRVMTAVGAAVAEASRCRRRVGGLSRAGSGVLHDLARA
jgi:hypothetical protein